MSFIAINLDDAKEATAAPKGAYELQITSCQVTETGPNSKHPGTPMLKFTLGFTDMEINSPSIMHYMVFPYDGQTEYLNLTLLGIKRFLVHFGIPYGTDGIDPEAIAFEAIGKVATCNVDLGTPNENGDVFNKLGNLPRLKEELSGGRGKTPGKKRA